MVILVVVGLAEDKRANLVQNSLIKKARLDYRVF